MYKKFPRTHHLPSSPGRGEDDVSGGFVYGAEARELAVDTPYVVITEKMDGENTTIYPDGHCHARSISSQRHPSRSTVRALAAERGWQLPEGWRVCGENLYARHSIAYDHLTTTFQVFAIIDEQDYCLGWQETMEWCEVLGLTTVPVLVRGPWLGEKAAQGVWEHLRSNEVSEGFVVRVIERFPMSEYGSCVAKWVRKGHVQTDEHWMNGPVVPNSVGEV